MTDDEPQGNPLLKVKVRRQPTTGIELTHVELLRNQLMHEVEQAVALVGQPAETLRFYVEGAVEEYDLGDAVQTDPEAGPALAAMFVKLGQQEGPIRRFRVGELAVAGDGDRRRRAIAILEVMSLDEAGLPARWWTATRLFGQGEAGIGVTHGDWVEAEGDDPAELPVPFGDWVDAAPEYLEMLAMRETAQAPPTPVVRAAVGRLVEPVPDDALGVARVAGGLTLGDATGGPMSYLLVLVLRGRDYERWEIRGEPGCSMDDLMRAIAAFSRADAIGLVHPGVVELQTPQGEQERRALLARMERNGQMALHLQTQAVAADGRLEATEAFLQDLGESGDEGWLGVDPTVEVTIDVPPPPDAGWGAVGEG
jgi:hypothetical protein